MQSRIKQTPLGSMDRANANPMPEWAPTLATATPYYAACDWSWQSLSLLDFALLSELAYMDEAPDDLRHITVIPPHDHTDILTS